MRRGSRPPRGGRGEKYQNEGLPCLLLWSPSSRRAWVEITMVMPVAPAYQVALLAEGVGRNLFESGLAENSDVALLAEGVGRNQQPAQQVMPQMVALLAEGVGRNG